ncbi:MAG: aminoglycoside phosphotransferase family enzyme, partial [Myxococcota bacterium]
MSEQEQDTIKPLLEINQLRFIETRRSQIFFSQDQAWKIKKPLRGDSTVLDAPQVRRDACERELERGRLHAPGVYLGVVPVTRDRAGALFIDGEGETVDWAVHMRGLPDCDRADHRLINSRLDDDHIRRIAEHVEAFHSTAPVESRLDSFDSPAAISSHIEWAFGRADQLEADDRAAVAVQKCETWQHDFIRDHASLFRQRLLTGRVRDGHGDLCLKNIFLDDADNTAAVDGGHRSFEFRMSDVAADVATLSLDLSVHGRVDLAERFIAAYTYAANDFDLYSVIDFYESCRANLEGKTADQLRRDDTLTSKLRERTKQRAVLYERAALAFERRPFLPPMVVALSGLVATGKSSVARAVAHQIAAPLVSSDATRDFMLRDGGDPAANACHEMDWEKSFHPGFRDEVYNEVFRRAEMVLASGRPIVIDGCFGTRSLRTRARQLAQRFA